MVALHDEQLELQAKQVDVPPVEAVPESHATQTLVVLSNPNPALQEVQAPEVAWQTEQEGEQGWQLLLPPKEKYPNAQARQSPSEIS